jgi:hypothetical protein
MMKISMRMKKSELFEIAKQLHYDNYELKREHDAMVIEMLSFAKVIQFYAVNFRPRDGLIEQQDDDIDFMSPKKEKDGLEIQ